jgi:hypothetical protein
VSELVWVMGGLGCYVVAGYNRLEILTEFSEGRTVFHVQHKKRGVVVYGIHLREILEAPGVGLWAATTDSESREYPWPVVCWR